MMNVYTVEIAVEYEGNYLKSAVGSFEEAMAKKDAIIKDEEKSHFPNSVQVTQWTDGERVWSEVYEPRRNY